ncbi:hypothetical protein RFI_37608 [Reticulomyxa filosa]|uniref:Transposase Tc1-like domain-containing protein n=1 Tax=Reticulomyxa filosa TaxID=46433 RepID=X6LGN5_RETFI|nr:hypothetical protein RFI_37608 [Reticulomyxa filosa]|eukprot:ETN99859.1 hypothetical protein RFI_37608 [Reticulomyxa filosa]
MVKHFCAFEKGVAVGMLVGGASIRSVAKKFNNSKKKIWIGRSEKIPLRVQRKIVRWLVSVKCETAKDVKKELDDDGEIKVSYETVTRTLKRNGLIAVTKKKKPDLDDIHIKARLEFANLYKYWTVDDCKKVIFSDETKINLRGSDGIKYVWKKPNQDLGDSCIIKDLCLVEEVS